MTKNELISIKESIERIEKFQENFPKKIVCNDVRWQKFFDWEENLCRERAVSLAKRSVDNSSQLPLVDI